MATTMEEVIAKAETVEIEPKTEEPKNETVEEDKQMPKDEAKKEEVPVETEPKTGVSFQVKLDDRKQLNAEEEEHARPWYEQLNDQYSDANPMPRQQQSKYRMKKDENKPEVQQNHLIKSLSADLRDDIITQLKCKNFDEGLGASIKKLTGGKNDELTRKIIG
ncbi:hypothetical protein Acr_27g0007970 [Actinidia rufa]|uniref:Uncharacterized protein n=1 Tax=Actinidia rufa TaxID=165716 RepID=A0A7J0H7Q0_9ERIC|nr:hypothetical protein Acr_27g0007970 [Actinidia rufa]